jgi:hypothetical protein
VEIQKAGAEWIPAEKGMALDRNTLISTGFKSTAVISAGGSAIIVRPLTRLSLRELAESGGNEQVDLQLRSGRIRAEVNPPRGGSVDFTIHSPIATASVRGTVFDFDVMNLSVIQGTVAFSGADGVEYPVRSGESSYVSPTGETISPKTVAETNLKAALPLGAGNNQVIVTAAPAAPAGALTANPGGNWPGGASGTGGATVTPAWPGGAQGGDTGNVDIDVGW